MNTVGSVDVSRETYEKLTAFAELVEKWTLKINLISKSSAKHIWDRHIVDSAQLFGLTEKSGSWVDIGSGGGFPGIVIAILSEASDVERAVTLIESDQRKCVFLRAAIRELELSAIVISKRIEDVEPLYADVISARALTDITGLLGFAKRHLKPDGIAIFPKGQSWQQEHEDAQSIWQYDCETISSVTNPAAAILKIKDISRV